MSLYSLLEKIINDYKDDVYVVEFNFYKNKLVIECTSEGRYNLRFINDLMRRFNDGIIYYKYNISKFRKDFWGSEGAVPDLPRQLCLEGDDRFVRDDKVNRGDYRGIYKYYDGLNYYNLGSDKEDLIYKSSHLLIEFKGDSEQIIIREKDGFTGLSETGVAGISYIADSINHKEGR